MEKELISWELCPNVSGLMFVCEAKILKKYTLVLVNLMLIQLKQNVCFAFVKIYLS